jgi:hypothetical protein
LGACMFAYKLFNSTVIFVSDFLDCHPGANGRWR